MNGVSENTEANIITIDNGEHESTRLDTEIELKNNFHGETNDMTKPIKASLKKPQNYKIDDELLADDEKIFRVNSNVVGDTLTYENNLSLSAKRAESNEISSVSNSVSICNGKKPIKRHSTSIELTAMTSVRTGEDGVPVISFSFLQNDEKALSLSQQDNTLYDFPRNSRLSSSVESPDNIESACEQRLDLYDFPKSNRVLVAKPQKNYDNTIIKKCDSEESVDELYDIPRGKNSESKGEFGACELESKNSVSLNFPADFGGTGEEHEEQQCYSDPEEDFKSREKRRRHRFGKAWGRMRSWLRDEKIRINEVVQRHARMQAVGANLKSDIDKSSGCCGSYDLVEARAKVLGEITVIDEIGLSSVSEEVNVSEGEETGCRSAREDDDNKASAQLRKMKSTENIGRKIVPVSFSLDKLCDEGEERRESEAEEKDRHWGRGGLIKRRMLGSIRGLMASTHLLHQYDGDETGPGGFEDVRRYVKQGGDFCKELAAILHERAELEASYAKGLSKLSSKLTKACAKDQGGNSSGGVNEAWRNVGEEMEAAAEAHRVWGIALSEQLAKPLRVGVAEAQGRSRKSIESSVDKASKSLQEWRGMAAKSKKQSFACARENERLQDLARLQSISQSQQNNNKNSSHHMTEKEVTKLENRRRKAEDSSRRADTEFYTVSVRAERARLEYECTVRRGAKQMELLEEERLSALKDFANVYLSHLQALAPRLQQSADRLSSPVRSCSVSQDVDILKNLIRRLDNNETPNVEQLLPDFYAEHVTLAMNRERRKQALVRVLHLIRQDLEREKRGREGLETLHRAFIQTPAFAADESTQNVTDKLLHMRSMLTYLEAARYKVGGALAEIEGGKKGKHPLAEHILVSRDKQGLQQSVLKVPLWAKNETFELPDDDDFDLHLTKDERNDWVDRTAGDGNSENPPDEEDFSDFDEFSSQSEDNNNQEVDGDIGEKGERTERCRALYQYSANLNDELSLSPGDLITIHQKQEDGWWIGECGGRTGIFPATYVQVLH